MFNPISIMNDDLLEQIIRKQISATTADTIIFSWHGGEPLLAGIPFYEKAVLLQKKYCPPGKQVLNGLQTNGTLLNDAWGRFLSSENFLVGISMDGPEELHNIFRKGKDGNGTFRDVLRGYDLLVMWGIEPEILCVVSSGNSSYPIDVYRFFRHLGASFITFIPLVEKPDRESNQAGRSVNPVAFGEFLCAVFEEWMARDIGSIKIQIIEEALRTAFDQEHTLCVFKKECGGVPVIEHNGSVFACDHFVNEDHRLGNIRDAGLEIYLDSDRQKAFGCAKRNALPDYCIKCDVIGMCNGECIKNRFNHTPTGEPGLNYLCEGYKMFFRHIKPFAEEIRKISATQ
jgi:uncharacterized protein